VEDALVVGDFSQAEIRIALAGDSGSAPGLMAGEDADPEGLLGDLRHQAIANPVALMALLGKVLPLQMTSGIGGPLEVRRLPPQEPPSE
jgi:hypothetical protein